jgi:hypothetical protein
VGPAAMLRRWAPAEWTWPAGCAYFREAATSSLTVLDQHSNDRPFTHNISFPSARAAQGCRPLWPVKLRTVPCMVSRESDALRVKLFCISLLTGVSVPQ